MSLVHVAQWLEYPTSVRVIGLFGDSDFFLCPGHAHDTMNCHNIFLMVPDVLLLQDLAIYAVSVATTLEKAVSASHQLSYYSFLWGFIMLIGPFCFFNFQKTTYLQLFTMVMRNSAMVLMILLTVFDIANGHHVPINQLILWDTEKAKEVCKLS